MVITKEFKEKIYYYKRNSNKIIYIEVEAQYHLENHSKFQL